MIKKKMQFGAILCLLIFAALFTQAQKASYSEKDLIQQAQTLFEQEKWKEALPLLAQLVSVYPDNPDLNYKFGVCTLLGDRSDRRRPIRYLNNAYQSMSSNTRLLYYLGLAYYQNQEYTNAITYFKLYQSKTDLNSDNASEVYNYINACQNAIDIDHKNLVAEIISKNEFQKDNFHRAYPAEAINGALIQKPDFLISQADKNNNLELFVYISETKGVLYFSAMADSHSSNRDIFKVTYDDEGQWGVPEKIPGDVNTFYDENYPVITNNGQTLYFSSKGHNSIGGYDIFKSTFDTKTQTFGKPENMGNSINSPFDDFLYVPDKTGNFAFFASNRNNLDDGITVYKVRLMDEKELQAQMLALNAAKTDQAKHSEFSPSNSVKPSTVAENLNTNKESNNKIITGPANSENPNSNPIKEPQPKESITTYSQVDQVKYKANPIATSADDESLEISTDNVESEVIIPSNIQKDEPAKTITNASSYKTVNPVLVDEQAKGIQIQDEPIHITQTNYETLLEKSKSTTSIETVKKTMTGSVMPMMIKSYSQSSETSYITCTQTDKSHAELIKLALLNPDTLTYEELLLAAELVPNPAEKLKLYRSAFIHIDRDWRAYYNASIAAEQIIRMDEAEVYRYQSDLISKELVYFYNETEMFFVFVLN